MTRVQLLTIIVWAMSHSIAHADELHAYFTKMDDPRREEVAYSECLVEDVGECVAHSISCDEDHWFPPEFTIIVGPVEQIATNLITATDGRAKGNPILAGGATTITLEINSIDVDANELDGGWTLGLGVLNGDIMFDAFTSQGTEGAVLELAGRRFPIAPQSGDGAKLMELKKACDGFRSQ